MRNSFFRCVVAPLIFWLVSVVLCALFLPKSLTGFVGSYALLLLTCLLTWWGIAFARWLRSRGIWETIAYLLSNLILGLMPTGIGAAIGFALAPLHNTLATLVFLLCCLIGVGWLLTSIWRRLREWRQKQYTNIFWRPLQSNAWIWRVWQQTPVVRQPATTVVEGAKSTMATASIKRANPLFRRVPISADVPLPTTAAFPIPPRTSVPPVKEAQPAKSPPQTEHPTRDTTPSPISIAVTLDNEQATFVTQAQQLVSRTETQAEPVSFPHYSPTYADMSPEQQRWYFYWRTAVRSGRFLPTDINCLLVYAYECINLIGFDTPQLAFERLVTFWQHYRVLQPKLDQYLIDWIADFAIVHRLSTSALAWYGQVVTSKIIKGDVDLLIEGWLHRGGDCTLLPNQLLYQLAGYSPENSKFYEAHHRQQNLDAAYLKGVQAVDAYLRQNVGIPLFIQYAPLTMRPIQRLPFAGALHGYSQTPILIAQVRPWQAQEPLTQALKAILKQTENVLREQLQFKTKLRGITLPPAWSTAIEQALKVPTPKRTVTIDFESIASLKRDSEEIRQRLSVADEEVTTLSPTEQEVQQPQTIVQPPLPDIQLTRINVETQGANASSSYTNRPENAPVGLLTELAEIAAVMGEHSSAGARLLAKLRKQDWQASPAHLKDEKQNGFLNLLLDQLNEQAVTHLGDALVFDEGGLWVVAEDYRDEIAYILDHPAYAIAVVPEKVEPGVVDPVVPTPPALNGMATIDHPEPDEKAELPPEWLQLSNHLQPPHWNVMTILLQGENVNPQLDTLARQMHTTANQLIDQINERALDCIGDIVIHVGDRTPFLEDEHVVLLRRIDELHVNSLL